MVHNSFSTGWQGPPNSQHVLVDGMLNGWFMAVGSEQFSVYYKPAGVFQAAEWISSATLVVILLSLVWSLIKWIPDRLADRRNSRARRRAQG